MNRRIALLVLSALAACAPARAAELEHRVRLDAEEVSVAASPAGWWADFPGAAREAEVGVADLPARLVSVDLPRGERVVALDWSASEATVLCVHDVWRRVTRAAGGPEPGTGTPIETAPAPSEPVTLLGYATGERGERLAQILWRPLDLRDGALRLTDELRLHLTTAPDEGVPQRLRTLERGTPAAGPFAPREFPALAGSPVDAVIITNEAMAAAYQTLADWHVRRGTRTVVRTVEWIADNYVTGSDLPENIRLFLQDAYALWGLTTVALGGDTDQLPTRYVRARAQGAEFFEVPTDAYYACLEGNWNANGNGYWGEAGNATGDGVNLTPELAIGRMATRTATEAAALVAKIIAYRETRESGFQNRMALMAEVLFPSDWAPGDYINLDGAEFVNATVNNLLSPDIDYTALLENHTEPLWEALSPVALSRQSAYDSMDTGNFAFIDHCGHGFRYNMSVGDASISLDMTQSLANPMPFHISLMNCTSTAYDFDCLGENFLRNPDHGAIAVFGTSRNSYPDWNWQFLSTYYARIFQSDETRIGEALRAMRANWAPACLRDGFNRWSYFIITLLGDPLLDLWAGEPVTYEVSAPAEIVIDDQIVTIHVEAEGAGIAGARVTAWKAGEAWATGTTDAGGDCALAVRPLTPGDLTVTVWGANAFMETVAVPVTTGGGTCVHVSGFVLDDDTDHDPANIADGLLAAGETARLALTLSNSGASAAENVSVTLHALSDSLTILTDQEAFGYVPRNGSVAGAGELAFRAADGCGDGTRHGLLVEIAGSAETRSDTLFIEVFAAEPTLAEWTITDPVFDGGNGDGVWDPGEPLRAAPRWLNTGQAPTGPLSIELTSVAAGLTVSEGTAALASLAPLAAGAPDPGLLISLADPTINNAGELTLTDARGRVWTATVDFKPPLPPTDLRSGASSNPDEIALSWTPNAANDIRGYNVYMKQAVMPAFARQNPLPLASATLELTGLAMNCLTDFYVTSVDVGGVESVPSDTLKTSTNPAQLAGFPLETQESCASTVAVGNVAGDVGLELVTAGGYLHVWHHDGSEARDGDNESQTFGVYTDVTDNITGSVTLLPLLRNGYRQIVVASAADSMIYVFDHEGGVVSGWPRRTNAWVWCNILGADLDGDGDLEVVAVDVAGNVYAFNHDGTDFLPGSGGQFHPPIGAWSLASPAAADFDGDGAQELVLSGTYERLYVVRGDGTDYPGFPVLLDPEGGHYKVSRSPLLVADIDNDGGSLEIVLQSDIDSLYVFRADGSRQPGFPLPIASLDIDVAPSPAPADIDGDGDLELLVVDTAGGGDSRLHLVHHDGTTVPGWPVELDMHTQTSPVAGDVDGDGALEFIIGSEQGIIYGFNIDGTRQAGFPIDVGGEVRGTPTLADLDNDGDVELIVATWNRRVLVWDLEGAFGPETCPWPTVSGNYFRNGLWGDWDDVPVLVSDIRLEALAAGIDVGWSVAGEVAAWDLLRSRRLAPGSWSEPESRATGLAGVGGSQSFLDTEVEAGATYRYSARGWLGDAVVIEMLLGEIEAAPSAFVDRLVGAWPNPFNPTTTIRFESSASGPVELSIYSARGRLVRRLHAGELAAGPHELTWDGRDDAGRALASGVYLARLRHGAGADAKRLVLLK